MHGREDSSDSLEPAPWGGIGTMQKILGENVAAYRRQAGASQEEFAPRLDLHHTYLASIERGEKNLSLAAIERLAAKMGVKPLDLLRRRPDGDTST